MGMCQSAELSQASKWSRHIDLSIRQDKRRTEHDIKLLLLGLLNFSELYFSITSILFSWGTTDCGKSTILKQMRILHDLVFTDEELRAQRAAVYSNILLALCTLTTQMHNMGIVVCHIDFEVSYLPWRTVQGSHTYRMATKYVGGFQMAKISVPHSLDIYKIWNSYVKLHQEVFPFALLTNKGHHYCNSGQNSKCPDGNFLNVFWLVPVSFIPRFHTNHPFLYLKKQSMTIGSCNSSSKWV